MEVINLNQDYKRNANKNKIPVNLKELKENTLNHMNALQNNPEKVANFFKHPSVAYAAWDFGLFGGGVIIRSMSLIQVL